MNRAVCFSPAALVIYHPHVFAETLPSCSHLKVFQGETTSAHTCRALLSLPKQTASLAVQTACHLQTWSDSTRNQRNPFASLALGLMKKIRYVFLAVPTRHPLPSHTSDAADFAEPKPAADHCHPCE